jgi:hypothetical protein
LGDTRRTIAFWEEARSLFREQGDTLRVADLDMHLSSVMWEAGDHERCKGPRRDPDPRVSSSVTRTGHGLCQAGSVPHALVPAGRKPALGEQALQLARELGQERIQVHALITMGTADGDREVEQGIESLEESLKRPA